MSIISDKWMTYATVRDVILEMDTPFLPVELLAKLQNNYNIFDNVLALSILDDLRDAGLVTNTFNRSNGRVVYSSYKLEIG